VSLPESNRAESLLTGVSIEIERNTNDLLMSRFHLIRVRRITCKVLEDV
jgi:hypothetical protein